MDAINRMQTSTREYCQLCLYNRAEVHFNDSYLYNGPEDKMMENGYHWKNPHGFNPIDVCIECLIGCILVDPISK